MSIDQNTPISDSFRQTGHKLIDLLADYYEQAISGSIPVTTPLHPDESLNYWNNQLLSKSTDIDLFKNILEKSIHLHHPGYVGHQVATPDLTVALASLLAAALNNGMAVYEMGQVSVAMEKLVCKIITDLINWNSNSSGFFTSGGTLANLTVLLTARQIHSQLKYWNEGSTMKYAVMVSQEAHYCIERAAKIMGLGDEGIILIPTNQQFQLDTSRMEEYYQIAVDKGLEVFAFVANAGSTGTGSYDDLEAIAAFCKSKKIWMHVDGAHGGAVLFSKKYNHLIQGIEHADSMTLDFHKLLQTPILCTALVYKNGSTSYQTFAQGAKYLYDDQSPEWYQLGKRTFECTKTMMVLSAYTALQSIGQESLGAAIDYRYDLAKAFAERLIQDPAFEIATFPQSNIICFRFALQKISIENQNLIHTQIRQNILRTGKFYLVQTQIGEKVYLRCSLMNIHTTIKDLDALTDLLKEEFHSIIHK